MTKPLDERSDDELKRVAAGELGEKKAIVAEEILRRRKEVRTEKLKVKYAWLGGLIAAVSLVVATARRLWRKE